MRLFLIRHAETVDNVAGLYAGSRDSALTSHGVLQARRLGDHLRSLLFGELALPSADCSESVPSALPSRGNVTILSSNLARAAKTAQAILDALQSHVDASVRVIQLADLREKHFGTGEGLKYGVSRAKDSSDREEHVGAESGYDMAKRSARFVNDHLLPSLLAEACDDSKTDSVYIVVGHGLINSALFKALCARVLSSAITLSPEAQHATPPYPSGAPVLPSWSNTGFLEARLTVISDSGSSALVPRRPMEKLVETKMHVLRVNSVAHLAGLKKTRGGIGSSQFDEKQKTISSFFQSTASPSKKRRRDGDAAAWTGKLLLFIQRVGDRLYLLVREEREST